MMENIHYDDNPENFWKYLRVPNSYFPRPCNFLVGGRKVKGRVAFWQNLEKSLGSNAWASGGQSWLGMSRGPCVLVAEGQRKAIWRPKLPWNKPGTNSPFQKSEIAPHSQGRTLWYGGAILGSIALSGHPRGIQGHEQTQNDIILFNVINDLVFQFRPKLGLSGIPRGTPNWRFYNMLDIVHHCVILSFQ